MLDCLIRRLVHEAQIEKLRAMSVQDLRALWDAVDDETSFCGEYDCADIHLVLNEKGDGEYCIV